MKKSFLFFVFILLMNVLLTAQSDEDLFGSDDDWFGGDDFLIEEVEDVSAKTDLSKGILFDNGNHFYPSNIVTLPPKTVKSNQI